MDPGLERALRAIDGAVADVAHVSGPVRLSDEYLRAVERVEALPANQPGADKTWIGRAREPFRTHFARARRR